MNFNYRLAPQNKYPAAIEDVAYIIHYIHENAGMLHLDTEKFYMLGIQQERSLRQITVLLPGMQRIGASWISLHMTDFQRLCA